MDAVVSSVLVFTEPERSPGRAIHVEQVSLDPSLVVSVELARSDGAAFNGVHFGHGIFALD
jgi:hypothetical protein